MDRANTRASIQQRLDSGALPRTPPTRMFAGRGTGAKCDGCGDQIRPEQVEYEFFDAKGGRTFRMHLGCAGVWETFRTGPGTNSP
jgi:hypothetical protein